MTTATTPHRPAARTASSHADAAPARSDPVRGAVRRGNAALGRMIPVDVPLFMLRVFPAAVFWLSARTKVDGFAIADSTYFLFQHEYALPVIPSALAAVRKNEHDLALGNVLGSNLFNTLAVVGIAGAITPVPAEPAVFYRDWVVMTVLTVALFLMGYGFRGAGTGRINRIEGGILLAIYLGYTGYLVSTLVPGG